MKKNNIFLLFVIILNFSFLYSEEKRTVTSFFAQCKNKSCCEPNLVNCKSKLINSKELCQTGYDVCKEFTK